MKIDLFKFMRALLFIVCVLIGLYMSYIFIVNGLSWFGLYLIIMSYGTAGAIYTDFEEETKKKMSSTRNTQHLKRYVW